MKSFVMMEVIYLKSFWPKSSESKACVSPTLLSGVPKAFTSRLSSLLLSTSYENANKPHLRMWQWCEFLRTPPKKKGLEGLELSCNLLL